MIPKVNLYEIKEDIINNLATNFLDIQVRDGTAKSEDFGNNFKVCKVILTLGSDIQNLSSTGSLDLILYYYKPDGIESDMNDILQYLLYNEIDGSLDERVWETTTWRYKLSFDRIMDSYYGEQEFILPARLYVRVYGK
jgi:hypothetical protein